MKNIIFSLSCAVVTALFDDAGAKAEAERLTQEAMKLLDAEVRRRWLQLAARLESFYWEWERNGRVLPVYAKHPEPMRKQEKAKGADHL